MPASRVPKQRAACLAGWLVGRPAAFGRESLWIIDLASPERICRPEGKPVACCRPVGFIECAIGRRRFNLCKPFKSASFGASIVGLEANNRLFIKQNLAGKREREMEIVVIVQAFHSATRARRDKVERRFPFNERPRET